MIDRTVFFDASKFIQVFVFLLEAKFEHFVTN